MNNNKKININLSTFADSHNKALEMPFETSEHENACSCAIFQPIYNPTMIPINYPNRPPVSVSYESGQKVFSSQNNLYIFEAKKNTYKRTDLSFGCFKKIKSFYIYEKANTKVLYFYISFSSKTESEKQLVIPEEYLNSSKKFFYIFSQEKMEFSKSSTTKDMLDLILFYLLPMVKETGFTVPFSPGWQNGKFLFNEKSSSYGTYFPKTPFFKKKLNFDEEMSAAEASKKFMDCINSATNKIFAMIIFILIHTAMLFTLLPKNYSLKKPVVLYGVLYNLKKISELFFTFYESDETGTIYLHDNNIVGKIAEFKDDIVLIIDDPKSPYDKSVAEKNFAKVKDFINSDSCQCICIIFSDYGIVEPNDHNLNLIVENSDLQAWLPTEDSALPTHLKHFTSWVEKQKLEFSNITEEENYELNCQLNLFLSVLQIVVQYYKKVANIDIRSEFELDPESAKSIISSFLKDAQNDMSGNWLGDKFKEIFFKMKHSEKLIIQDAKEFFSFEEKNIIVLEYRDTYDIKYTDMEKFLKYFPKNVRVLDVVRELKSSNLLIADKNKNTRKRCIKNQYFNMVSIKKEFLSPETGDL